MMLTQEGVKALFDYTPHGDLVRKMRRGRACSVAGYLSANKGYWFISIDGVERRRCRLVFLWHHGYLPERVRHLDGDRANDRIENLAVRGAPITLTQERVWQVLRYDADTGKLYRRSHFGGTEISGSDSGYIIVSIDNEDYRAHRLIWFMHYGTWPENVDHISGDIRDNRLSNLRSANITENARNRKRGKNNTSGVKGVSFCKDSGLWLAYIYDKARRVYLGRHRTLEQATHARRAAAQARHGEFVRHE